MMSGRLATLGPRIASRLGVSTGERVTRNAAGHNPTWQRHVAAYRLAAPFLTPGPTLDLGCGIGHSFSELPSVSIGLDREQSALRGQSRPAVVADMRRIPLRDGSLEGVVSVQSIEHVPDPGRVVAEIWRVLRPGGIAVIVTPNRLTFGRPDEIIDPYHHIEFSPDEMRRLCATRFSDVRILGVGGSPRYVEIVAADHRSLDRILGLDPLRLRRMVPRRARQVAYDVALSRMRRESDPRAAAISVDDFHVMSDTLDECLDVMAVCRR